MSYTWPIITIFSPFPMEGYVRSVGNFAIKKFSLTGRERPELLIDAPICENIKTMRFCLFAQDNNQENNRAMTRYTFEVSQCSGELCKVSIVFLMNVPEVLDGHKFCQKLRDPRPLIQIPGDRPRRQPFLEVPF